MKPIFATLLLVAFSLVIAAGQTEINLYTGTIPNSKKVEDPEYLLENRGPNNRAFKNTAVPTLTIYRPEEPNGTAIIICPGGAYSYTAFDKEGTLVAQELVKSGISVFILKYRIPQDLTNVNKSIAPLQDAQQAIRYVRSQANRYGLRSDRIGIMGFSAGGHLASSAATHFTETVDYSQSETVSVRPDFVALIYPVISFESDITHMGSRTNLIGGDNRPAVISYWSNDQMVSEDSPPAFLIHAADDDVVPIQNSINYYLACLANEVPAEMHLYPKGGHGFGLYNSTTDDLWIERLVNWINRLD